MALWWQNINFLECSAHAQKWNVGRNVGSSGQTHPTFHPTFENKICFWSRSNFIQHQFANVGWSNMGGQTDPTFHPTLVLSMLDEMLDAFDQGFTWFWKTRKFEHAEMNHELWCVVKFSFTKIMILCMKRLSWELCPKIRNHIASSETSSLENLNVFPLFDANPQKEGPEGRGVTG